MHRFGNNGLKDEDGQTPGTSNSGFHDDSFRIAD